MYISVIRLIAGKLYAACYGPDLLVSTDSGATWNYSGLGLGGAADVYADPTGTIRILYYPQGGFNSQAAFTRVDQLHCLWTEMERPVKISSDGGITWSSTGINTFDGVGCYGDTCNKVFIFDATDSVGDAIINRSTDFGASWQKDTIGKLHYPAYLEGSSRVIYAFASTDTIEGARSTDDGDTWTFSRMYPMEDFSVRNSFVHIPVFGPIGEYSVVAFSTPGDSIALYLITTGGDGTLHDVTDPLDSTGFPLPVSDTIRVVSNCSGFRVPIPLQGSVDSIYTVVKTMPDTIHFLSVVGSSSFMLKANQRDTAWFAVSPGLAPSIDTVTVAFQNSWRCSNWTESWTILVTTLPSALAIAPAPVTGSCDLVYDTGFLMLDSCQSVVITNVSVSNFSGERLKFQGILPDSVHYRYHYSLPFLFDPRDTNADGNAIVELRGYYLGTPVPFDTSFVVHVTATPTPPQLAAPGALAFTPLSTCVGFEDTGITFRNYGCSPDTIKAISLTGVGFSSVNDSLPILVQPGDSVSFEYRFIPPDSGSYSGTVKLHVTSMGLTEDPQITLTGRGVQGMGVLDVRSTSLQAGSFSFCDGDTTLTDTLRNTGCDTLVLSNIRFGGDSAFSLLSSPGDSLLLPGGSAILQFYFAPRVKGAHSAMLSFHERNIVNDPGHDTTITIVGTGLGGTTALSADTAPRNFGALFECEERDTTIWLKNPGCDTLTVTSASFSNSAYSLDTALPIIIAGKDSVAVRVHLMSTASPMNGSVTFFSNANSGSGTGTVPLQATAIPPSKLMLSLSPSAVGAHGNAPVTFYVILEGDTSAAARKLTGMNFDLTHNDDLLSLLNGSGVTRIGTGGTPERQVDTFAWKVGLEAPTYADTIGSLTFQVYLTDSSSTPLTLSNISFQIAGDLPPDCIASIGDSGSGFTYLYQCGNREIQNTLLTGSVPFTIESIVPNPAKTEIRVRGKGQWVKMELLDVLGRTALPAASDFTLYPLPFTLDVSALPSGIYFLRLSENGYVQTRQISIEH